MLLRNKIITICVILLWIYLLLDLWNYLNFNKILDHKINDENNVILIEKTENKKNPEVNLNKIEENKDTNQKNIITELDIIKKDEPIKIKVVELDIKDHDGNGWYTSTVLPTMYWFQVKDEWLEFYFNNPITIYSDHYIWFWPMSVIPESPTDKVIKTHYYNLKKIEKNNTERKLKMQMWSSEVYYSSEWGMCDLRKYILLWIYNDIEISSSGCHTSKEEDNKYIENVFKNLVKKEVSINIEIETETETEIETVNDNLKIYRDGYYNLSLQYPNNWKISNQVSEYKWSYRKIITINTEDFLVWEYFPEWARKQNIEIEIFTFKEKEILNLDYGMFFWKKGNKTLTDKFWNITYIEYYIHYLNTNPLSKESPGFEEYLQETQKYNSYYKNSISNLINSIELYEDKNLYVIYNYYNNINQKNYKTAYDLKNNPWYSLDEFIKIYQTVTETWVEFNHKEANNYHLTVELVDNWITEEYSVILNINNDKITTVKTIKIN